MVHYLILIISFEYLFILKEVVGSGGSRDRDNDERKEEILGGVDYILRNILNY